MAERPTPTPPVPAEPAPAPARCANCGAQLQGPYCHQCGQSTRHVLKHLPALLEDGLDLVFNIDGRIMRTLPALYLRPGFLAREYFAGRRTRYIPPFRLMFFLSVLAFLMLQVNLNMGGVRVRLGPAPPPIKGDTPAQVRASFRQAEQQILAERAKPEQTALSRDALDVADQALRDMANARLRQLGAPPLDAGKRPAAGAKLADTTRARGYLQSIRSAPDVHSLQQRRAAARAAIATSLAQPGMPPAARAPLQALRGRIDDAAASRAAELAPAGAPAAPASSLASGRVRVAWLPGFLNQRIQEGVARARANWEIFKHGSNAAHKKMVRRIGGQALSILPQALFVMIPLFALLLNIVYLFRRRLYIEHLMVAMYSHAFLYLSLLMLGVIGFLDRIGPGWFVHAINWLAVAICLWIPVYLLLMQKRVYAQGWPMTLVTYGFVGLCYVILVGLAITSALVIGIAS